MTVDKNVFLALAAVSWADGKVEPDEADAIVRAALDCGLELDDIAAVEAAAAKPVELSAIDVPNMSKDDRLFVYAVACWIVDIDGDVHPEETRVLAELAELLGIPERQRAKAEGLVKEVAALPDERRPARYDVQKLRELVSERLGGGSSS